MLLLRVEGLVGFRHGPDRVVQVLTEGEGGPPFREPLLRGVARVADVGIGGGIAEERAPAPGFRHPGSGQLEQRDASVERGVGDAHRPGNQGIGLGQAGVGLTLDGRGSGCGVVVSHAAMVPAPAQPSAAASEEAMRPLVASVVAQLPGMPRLLAWICTECGSFNASAVRATS